MEIARDRAVERFIAFDGAVFGNRPMDLDLEVFCVGLDVYFSLDFDLASGLVDGDASGTVESRYGGIGGIQSIGDGFIVVKPGVQCCSSSWRTLIHLPSRETDGGGASPSAAPERSL